MPLSDDQIKVLGTLKAGPRRVGHTFRAGKIDGRVVRGLCVLGFVTLRPGSVAVITTAGLEAYREGSL
jgi:hypothetical protein